jgi:hypothetical protein
LLLVREVLLPGAAGNLLVTLEGALIGRNIGWNHRNKGPRGNVFDLWDSNLPQGA